MFGEHVFDEAQNAVEVSLYRALTQFESELQQEKKVVDAVISTDASGGSLFITGAFSDLLNWFFLDCGDDKFGAEFVRFLCIYRMFEQPQVCFSLGGEMLLFCSDVFAGQKKGAV